MFHIVLFEPEIPPNTGNIIRLCAKSGASLHLIHPLAFELDDKRLRRAGLDYHEYSDVRHYDNLESFLKSVNPTHLFACTTKATQNYTEVQFTPGDALLFGPETRGLPSSVLHRLKPEQQLRIPMRENSRSLTLSNAASIILYEAWRQNGFVTA